MEFGQPIYPLEFRHKSIEEYVAENVEDIELFLDDFVPQMLNGFEYDSISPYENIVKFATLLDSELAQDDTFIAVCYNSFRLGWLITDYALPHMLSMTYSGVIDDISSLENIKDQLLNSSQAVLANSPYIEGLIGRYSTLIDPTDKYTQYVDIFAGHAIAMFDNGERYSAIDHETVLFRQQIEEWEAEL